jgi:ribosomal protein S18 acetylase RimI-like enzyme
LSLPLIGTVSQQYSLDSHGEHLKMALTQPALLDRADTSDVTRLDDGDLDDLLHLYEHSYPGNWFDPRMLETGQYFGLRRAGGLISAGGVHVFSPRYRVAALGNIATHPDHRGKGYATAVTAALCKSLLATVDTIGCNVRADNDPARRCYGTLGFRPIASYHEFMAERNPTERR